MSRFFPTPRPPAGDCPGFRVNENGTVPFAPRARAGLRSALGGRAEPANPAAEHPARQVALADDDESRISGQGGQAPQRPGLGGRQQPPLLQRDIQPPERPGQQRHHDQVGRILGLAGEVCREHVADGRHAGHPHGGPQVPGQPQDAQSAQGPNHQPIGAERALAGPQQRRQRDRRRRHRAHLGIEARRAAPVDQRRPQQQLAVPGVVGDENEVGCEEVAGVEASGMSAQDQGDGSRQQDQDHQRSRPTPAGRSRVRTRTKR